MMFSNLGVLMMKSSSNCHGKCPHTSLSNYLGPYTRVRSWRTAIQATRPHRARDPNLFVHLMNSIKELQWLDNLCCAGYPIEVDGLRRVLGVMAWGYRRPVVCPGAIRDTTIVTTVKLVLVAVLIISP